MAKGLGIAALLIAIIAFFIPVVGIAFSILALVLATMAALGGDRAYATATPIVVAVNTFGLSPSMWLVMGLSSGAFQFVLVMLALPYIVMLIAWASANGGMFGRSDFGILDHANTPQVNDAALRKAINAGADKRGFGKIIILAIILFVGSMKAFYYLSDLSSNKVEERQAVGSISSPAPPSTVIIAPSPPPTAIAPAPGNPVSTLAAPPSDFRGIKWGSSPAEWMEKIEGPFGPKKLSTWKNPKKLRQFVNVPVAEETYLFENNKLVGGDMLIDVRENFDTLKTALINALGKPTSSDDNSQIYKWQWNDPSAFLTLSYNSHFERATVHIENGEPPGEKNQNATETTPAPTAITNADDYGPYKGLTSERVIEMAAAFEKRMLESNRSKPLMAVLKQPLITKDEVWQARAALSLIVHTDAKYATQAQKILDRIWDDEQEGERAMRAAVAKAVANDVEGRKEFAKTLQQNYWDANLDITVTVSGAKGTTLKLSYVLFNNPLVDKILNTNSFSQTCEAAGFTKIVFTDGYNKGWMWQAKKPSATSSSKSARTKPSSSDLDAEAK